MHENVSRRSGKVFAVRFVPHGSGDVGKSARQVGRPLQANRLFKPFGDSSFVGNSWLVM